MRSHPPCYYRLPRIFLARTPVNSGQEEGPRLLDLGPKMRHQEKVPLTCRRGEEAHGSGDILDRMAGLLIHERIRGLGAGRQSSRNVRSSSRRRSGSASMSISVIFPRATAKPITEKVGPPGARETIPATPFTSARRENRPRCEKARACSATARAPRTS